MPSATSHGGSGSRSSGPPPAAGSGGEAGAGAGAAAPAAQHPASGTGAVQTEAMKQILGVIDKKLRNLEKKKVRGVPAPGSPAPPAPRGPESGPADVPSADRPRPALGLGLGAPCRRLPEPRAAPSPAGAPGRQRPAAWPCAGAAPRPAPSSLRGTSVAFGTPQPL